MICNKNAKNVLKTLLFMIMFALICFLSINQAIAGNIPQQLEWKVSIGDSKTYTITKFHDPQDSDNDGNPNTVTTTVIKENNDSAEIVLQKGTIITIKVADLNESALIQITYNSNVSERVRQDSGVGFLQKTITDQKYWEEIAKQSPDCSIKGDLFTYNQKVSEGVSTKKYNMTSGWLEYYSLSIGESVEEISATTYQAVSVPLDFLAFFFGFLLLIIVIRHRRTQRKL